MPKLAVPRRVQDTRSAAVTGFSARTALQHGQAASLPRPADPSSSSYPTARAGQPRRAPDPPETDPRRTHPRVLRSCLTVHVAPRIAFPSPTGSMIDSWVERNRSTRKEGYDVIFQCGRWVRSRCSSGLARTRGRRIFGGTTVTFRCCTSTWQTKLTSRLFLRREGCPPQRSRSDAASRSQRSRTPRSRLAEAGSSVTPMR
jgi:hypothetical protein